MACQQLSRFARRRHLSSRAPSRKPKRHLKSLPMCTEPMANNPGRLLEALLAVYCSLHALSPPLCRKSVELKKDGHNAGKEDAENVRFSSMPVTLTANTCPQVLQYRWGRVAIQGSTARQIACAWSVFSFPQVPGAEKALQYKLEEHCSIFRK